MFLQSTNKILSEVKEEESNIEIGNFFNKTDEFVNQRIIFLNLLN
jgi:hypothetical protein